MESDLFPWKLSGKPLSQQEVLFESPEGKGVVETEF